MEQILEKDGCRLHYWLGGPEGGPLVIFTHGLCVEHHSWDAVLPVVAERYRVLAWDVRGHGLSQPAGQPFSVPLAADDLLALMDRLGYRQAVLVGHSNGTYIIQELAFRHPERVQALALADGTCITCKRSAFENWLVRVSPAFMALYPYETLKKSSLPWVSDRQEVRDYTYRAYSMLSRRDFLALWKGVSTSLHYEAGYRISLPLLLVHGEHDRMGDIARIAPRWAQRETNCRYEVIPDASHFAILDNPQVFNRLLMEFLGQWVPATTGESQG